ncbi:DUF5809 family protein, partial [Haloferax sp. Atlit-6N]|uniref:DUF5809 family protein n=1 Tax=Haloferax sp. Atlit-6N TaxID=2077205 RepID=UPI001F1F116C
VDEHPDYEVITLGSDDVDRVAWHAAPFAETVVAATFQNEREAAVGTLRKQAFSRLYRPKFEDSSDGSSADDDSETSDTGSQTSDTGSDADSSTETSSRE